MGVNIDNTNRSLPGTSSWDPEGQPGGVTFIAREKDIGTAYKETWWTLTLLAVLEVITSPISN